MFRAAVVQVVAPHLFAKGVPRERTALPQVDCLAQTRGEGLRFTGLIRVADQLRPRIGRALDSVQPRREKGRVAQVGIDVGPGNSALEPPRLTVADDAKAAGP